MPRLLIAAGVVGLVIWLAIGGNDASRPSTVTSPAEQPVQDLVEPAPVITVPVTATSTTVVSRALERLVPVVEQLPYATPWWTVDYSIVAGGIRLRVEVRAILNRADQRPQYEADLRARREEARAWLTAAGVDLATTPVTWSPPGVDTL